MAEMKADVLNRRVREIKESVTLGLESKVKAMQAKGLKVFAFGAGEPDFDTPMHIKKAASEALLAGKTKYAPVAGLPELRSAIADKLKKENGLNYEPSQVVVSCGAKHTLYNLITALCNEGDEFILPSPYWLSYPEMIAVNGGKCVAVRCDEKNDYKMTRAQFEAAITNKTKALIINSPSNPIGHVYTPAELKAIADVAVKRGILIIADEIYEKMVYDGAQHASIASFGKEYYDLTITVNGFSKACSMTGWRLGYFAGPKVLINAVSAFQSHSTSGPNTFAMYGAVEALKNPETVNSMAVMLKAFAERRDYMYKRLTAMKGVTCVKPMGAFYMLPNISGSGMGSVEFCDKLLEKEQVALVAGKAFDIDTNVRLSYACSMENIKEGMDRMERFLGSV